MKNYERLEIISVWEAPIPVSLQGFQSVLTILQSHPQANKPVLVPEVEDALVYVNPDLSVTVIVRKLISPPLTNDRAIEAAITNIEAKFGFTHENCSSIYHRVLSGPSVSAFEDYLLSKRERSIIAKQMRDVAVRISAGTATCNLVGVTKAPCEVNGAAYRCEIDVTSFDVMPENDSDILCILTKFGYAGPQLVSHSFRKFSRDYANMTGIAGVVIAEFAREAQTVEALMELNTFCGICGYFYNANLAENGENHPNVNNGYNCHHPEYGDEEDGIGCCRVDCCPLCYSSDGLVCQRCGNSCCECGNEECECEDDYVVATIPERLFDARHMSAVPVEDDM